MFQEIKIVSKCFKNILNLISSSVKEDEITEVIADTEFIVFTFMYLTLNRGQCNEF